jgi:ubiquinone/menaquinone biosynthesis C-methylase UbiE
MIFNQKVAKNYDKWYQAGFGKYTSSLEENLMIGLIEKVRGLRVLDVGCGTGNHLRLFKNLGAEVFGLDCSFAMLQKAKEKGNLKLILAEGERIPARDAAFDMTTAVTTLEFCGQPEKVLREMGRVSRERIFIGVLNSWSLLALSRRIKGWFKPSIYNQADFISIWGLKRLLKRTVSFRLIRWSGVCLLPYAKWRLLKRLDGKLSFRRNPFCAFLGVLVVLGQKRHANKAV